MPRRALSASQPAPHLEIKVAYCSHEQSPETLEMAQHHLGSDQGLRCAGHVRRCPLPEGVKPVVDHPHDVEEAMRSWGADESVPLEDHEQSA